MTRYQPPAPAAPPAPGTPAPAIAGQVSFPAIPMTQADVDALRGRGRELSNQLRSAQGRRDDLARELRTADDGVSKTGIEQRMQVLDGRLAQIEADIAANGQRLAAAPSGLLANATSEGAPSRNDRTGPFSSGQLTAVSIVFTLAVLMPMALAMARALFKRSVVQKPSPQVLESAERIERMEQAIDAIAVEIERISEGQRFVTQTLAKRADVPMLAGEKAAQPLSRP